MAPLLDTLALHSNPWRCDCAMAWFLGWSRAHPGLMKCPGGPQCPVCDTPVYLQGRGLLRQTDLPCTSPSIFSSGRDPPSAGDPGEMKALESFREPLGNASLGLSDHQGNSVDLSCNVTHTLHSPDIPPPDLSLPSAAPIPVALSLSLECAVERAGYESLWRILAYYSETAVRLERDIMLSKPPALAYRYRQTAETEGYYYTGVKASLKTTPHWILQAAVSLQLNRAQSSERKVQLILTTRVSVHPDPIYGSSSSSSLAVADPLSRHPWAMILSSTAPSAYAAVAGSRVEMSCPLVSSGNFTVHWILPDGSKLVSPYRSTDDRVSVSDSGILLHRTESSDAGLYYCVAQAGSDVDVLPLRLAVEESSIAATGEQIGASVTGQVGEFVTLLCNASGSPTPHIRWLLPDGNTVRHGTTVPGGASVQSNGSLSLAQASLKDDGSYRCMAVNQYGADSLSMRLDISAQAGPFRSSFHRGPQSASGRSTRIRAPLLRDTVVEDGSGDNGEEENPKVPVINRRRPQYPLNRRLPNGHPRRRGPIRGGKPLRKGGPPSQSQPGRNRFDSRQRVSATKQRIDPEKWADLLAKIRQRTTLNSTTPPTEVEELSLDPVDKETNTLTSRVDGEGTTGSKREEVSSDIDRVVGEGGNNRDRQQGEVETEGSAFEDVSLQEEGLQPIDHIITQTLTNTEIRTNTLPNTETESGTERNALSETQASNDRENKADTQTQSIPKTEAPTAQVTSKQISITNEIDLEKPDPRPTRFQNNHHRVNPVPNTRPESPLDTRRRTSQRRRPFTRFRVRPKTPPRPLPDPTSPGSQAVTLDTRSNQMSSSAPPTPFAVKETHGVDRIGSDSSLSNSLDVDPPSPTLFDSLFLSLSASQSPSYSPPRSPPPQTEEEEAWEEADEERGSPTGKPSDTLTLSTALPDLTQYDRLPPPLAPDISLAGEIQTDVQAQGQPPSGTHTDGVVPQHAEEMEEHQPFSSTFPSRVTSSPPPQTASVTSKTTAVVTTASTTPFTTVTVQTPASSTTFTMPNHSSIPQTTISPASPILPASPVSSAGNPILPLAPPQLHKVPVERSKPRISDPHIRSASVPAGSVARLDCEAQGEPAPTVTWTKVSTALFLSSGAVMSAQARAQRFQVLPNGTFVIHDVGLQDRGTYMCSAHSFLGRDRMLTTLEVWSRPPRMKVANYREATIHQGGDLSLDCQADAIPAPLLSWVLPDRSALTANSSHPRMTLHPNGTLHLREAAAQDRGVYRCVASNLAGAASGSVRLHVSSLPPAILQPREEQLVLGRGTPLYAHCSARGAPPPTLRWRTPDGTRVRPSQFLHGNLFVLPNGTLHVRRLGPADVGGYECTASNAVGVARRTVSVRLRGDAFPPLPPEAPRDRGETSLLLPPLSPPSSDHGPPTSPQPPPKINSAAAALPPTSSLDAGRSQPSSSQLSEPPPPPSHRRGSLPLGKTEAAPSFSAGDRSRDSSSPTHSSAPVSPLRKAHIVDTSPSATAVHYGGYLQLHCSVSGNPTPSIIWRTPARKLVDEHFSSDRRMKVHPNGTLLVLVVTEKDAGDYLCIARNKVADDYRLLRVTVSTKPAKIDPKQSANKMVPFGGSLKVDCLASGQPDPAVSWSLPDGTMVNSVLQGEEPGPGRPLRLTVFGNGTLLVPVMGVTEEGEYTCYAKNNGGQDTMKVKVQVMRDSEPSFSDAPGRHVTRVRPGATAVLRCRVKGDPVPTVTWFSPNHRVIPRSLGSRSFSERVVVVSDGTLEVRTAQRGDAGNYTCRARNAAGERSRMVGLELEELYYTPNARGTPNVLGTPNGRGTHWQGSSDVNPAGGTGSSRPHGDIHQYAPTHGAASRLASSGGVSSQSNSRVFSSPPTSDIQLANTGSKPPSPSGDSVGVQDRGSTAGLGHRLNTVGGNNNIAIRQGTAGTQRNQGAVTVNSGLAAVGGSDGWAARSSHNEPAYTGWLRGGATSFSSRSHATSGGTSSPSHATHTVSGVSSVQHRAGRGQTVLLPCPSHGSPPPRLYWLLPGNGVLPAPYYGSRLTVHRNGSLELRGLRPSDAGTLVCVVPGGGGETRVQVELSVSDPGGPGGELTLQREPAVVLSVSPRSGDLPRVSPGSVRSLYPTPLLPKVLRPGGPVGGTSPQGGLFLPSLPRPAAPVLVPAAPVADRQTPVVSIRTASLVSIINGEDLRLSCHAVPGAGGLQGSFSWTLPRGEVLSQGQSTGSGRYMVLPDGTLQVQQATVFDRGSYTCRSTPHGSATATAVTTPVIVIAYPPRVIKGPQPVTYTRFGVAIELPCLTIATPRAALTWETPDLTQLRVTGQARIYGNRFLSAQGSLVIQNPTSRDTGFYRCTAKNVMGADSKATYLHVV
ncbi:unnamed protein product [Arctogadus glacialis]